MSNPSFVTPQNVKFNGVLDNAVVLKDASNVRTLILWDNLTSADQQLLIDLIDSVGGDAPLAGPTSGFAKADFKGLALGASSTGLSAVATATAGVATVNVGGAATGSTPSGLSSSLGTHGYQVANFQPSVTTSTSTGVPLPTAGRQAATFSVVKLGTDPTGLANDATAYTATATIDGVAKAISVVGSAAQTFTTLVSEINTDLGAAGTAVLSSAGITVTSATTGSTSVVALADGTLFAALTNFTAFGAAVLGTGSNVNLTATIVVDGVSKAVSVSPSSLSTFADVLTALNTALGAAGTAAVTGGDIRVTSASFGTSSKVSITPGTLFPALAGFVNVFPAANGSGAARKYSATVVVDGSIVKTVSFTGVQGDTFQHVLDELNTDLGSAATASLSSGNVIITSATTGLSSSVKISDSGFLFASLAGYTKITDVLGLAPRVYKATVTVDGVAVPVSVQGSAAQTFTAFVSELNADLGAAATAAIVAGNIVITSATTGVSSSVVVNDADLFHSLAGFVAAGSFKGAADLVDVFKTTRTPAGNTFAEQFIVVVVGDKPAVPPYTPHSTAFRYFDGSVWRYLDDDTAI